MSRAVHTFALLAALVILVSCLWRDYGLLVSLKRVSIAYLGSFFLAGGLVLALRNLGWRQVSVQTDAESHETLGSRVEDEQPTEALAD